MHTYYDILEDKALLHFGFKLFGTGLLLEKFSIPDNNFTQLLTMIQNSFYEKSIYHSPKNTIQVTHNFAYFLRKGNINQFNVKDECCLTRDARRRTLWAVAKCWRNN